MTTDNGPLKIGQSAGTPLEILYAIFGYCSPDNYIGVGSMRPNDRVGGEDYLHPLAAIKVRDIYELLPGILDYQLGKTQYISFSTLSQAALLRYPYDKHKQAIRGEIPPVHFAKKQQHAAEIAALVLDLDVGRKHVGEAEIAQGVLLARARQGRVPWPSFTVLSGRGLYGIWLLRSSPDTERPPITTHQNIALHRQCMNALIDELSDLKPDPTSKDYVKYFKRPGTTDYKTGNEAAYLTHIGLNSLSNVPRYSLEEINDQLQLLRPPLDIPVEIVSLKEIPRFKFSFTDLQKEAKEAANKTKRKTKRGKGAEPFAKHIEEIILLINHRGKVPEGARYNTTWILYNKTVAYYHARHGKDEPGVRKAAIKYARKEIERLNKEKCSPPLSAHEINRACKQKGLRWSNSGIAERLNITEKEANDLGLEFILPRKMHDAKKQKERQVARLNKYANEKRRELVDQALIERHKQSVIVDRYMDLEIEGVSVPVSRAYVSLRKKKLTESGQLKSNQLTLESSIK